jgi:NAD(P)-dependent dehydrogenase (short-subunit alcohol dehydrogenase family)
MFRFDNQRVLIVGGSSGIGYAAAAGFAEAGASVTIAARNLERLKQAASKLGRGVQAVQLDVMDEKAIEQFFEREALWRHVVVSGSSVRFGPVRTLPLSDAYAAMNSKFWGAYRVARLARIEPEGSLTLVSGVLSRRPSPEAVLQGAINAGLEALAQGLALELSPVRVNTVSPGMIVTPLWDGIPEDKRRACSRRPPHSCRPSAWDNRKTWRTPFSTLPRHRLLRVPQSSSTEAARSLREIWVAP